MSDRCVEMPIDQAQPGMRLGDALRDAQGAILLPAGMVLGEAHLASLLRRGVATLAIALPDDAHAPDAAARREAVAASLAQRFRHGGEGEADRALYRAVLTYHLERMP